MRVVVTEPRLRHVESDHNLEQIRRDLRDVAGELEPDDLVVLPERFELRGDRDGYEREVQELARELRCHVVGGSHREKIGHSAVNSGVLCDGSGTVLGSYDKIRPYGVERQWVAPGSRLGEFSVAGGRILILVCADFWFVDLILRASQPPDLIVVPAFSVTRGSTPDYSRALWQHVAIARAYEFGSYVAVSDWSHRSVLPALAPAGVAGIADPATRDPARLFRKAREGGATLERLDFEALETFRVDRRSRGFYWRTNSDTPL